MLRGGVLIAACLSRLTIDHASQSRRSTVPTPNGDTSNAWALTTLFSIYYTKTVCLSYPRPVSPSAATTYLIYLLEWRPFFRHSLVSCFDLGVTFWGLVLCTGSGSLARVTHPPFLCGICFRAVSIPWNEPRSGIVSFAAPSKNRSICVNEMQSHSCEWLKSSGEKQGCLLYRRLSRQRRFKKKKKKKATTHRLSWKSSK